MNSRGPTGTNALHVAVWRNNVDLVNVLLEAGASPDEPDQESGWTPLHRAFYFGNLRIAAALMKSRANLLTRDWSDRFPIDMVSEDLAAFMIRPNRTHILSPMPCAKQDVYAWGAGTNFALGTGSTEPQVAPQRVDTLHDKQVVMLSAAKFHSAALTEDGALYTWGFGRGGRLGHPDAHLHSGESAVIAPRLVVGLGQRSVAAVSAAKHHTLLCTTAGEVWVMGSNRHGQLGITAVDTQPEPRRVGALKPFKIVGVAAANKHSVAVSAHGEVFSWGSNALGQLGYGTFDSTSSTTPRQVEALKGKRVVAIAAAKRHTLALMADGEVFTWGHRGVSPRRIQFAGIRDAVNIDGRPLRFHRGHNDVTKPTIVAVCAGAAHSSALTNDGVVLTWRSADPALLAQEVGGALSGKRVIAVSAGKYRTAVVTDRGDVYSWEGRSDFFPAEGRLAGSGSKNAKKGQRGGFPIPLPHSNMGRGGRHGGLGSCEGGHGSWGGRGTPGASSPTCMMSSGASPVIVPGSSAERLYATKHHLEGHSPGTGQAHVGPHGWRGSEANSPSPARVESTPFQPIAPQRVLGLKRAMAVAVGEKHSLAIQCWGALQLASLPALPWLVSSPMEERNSCVPESDAISDGENEDEICRTEPAESEKNSSIGPLTLQCCCEEVVASSMVDPRTVLQVLEYADAAGAESLKAYCLAVAVCNLDAVLLEARAAFEELPGHVMSQLENGYKGGIRKGLFVTDPMRQSSFKDATCAVQEEAIGKVRRSLLKKMQQIEHLQKKAGQGISLDVQQRAKVAQQQVLLAALAALENGMGPEDVQAMVQGAAAMVKEEEEKSHPQKAPQPAYQRNSKKSVSKSLNSGGLKAHTVSAIAPTGPGRHSETNSAPSPPPDTQVPVFATAASKEGPNHVQKRLQDTQLVVIGFDNDPTNIQRTSLQSSGLNYSQLDSKVGRKDKGPARKGALSMFLRGELDQLSQVTKTSSGPAWGGSVEPSKSINSPVMLKEIFSQQEREHHGEHRESSARGRNHAASSSTPGNTGTAKGSSSSSSASLTPLRKIHLSDFLSTPTSVRSKGPAWGGVGGGSPTQTNASGSGSLPSLRQIQEEQEMKRGGEERIPRAPRGASPPPSGQDRGNSGGTVLGTSPQQGGRATVNHYASLNGGSKWYVREEDEEEIRRRKSLAAIQLEESALQELAKKYGTENVRLAKNRMIHR